MPTAAAHVASPEIAREAPARPRVLVVRCCRAPQFAAAVTLARGRHPHAEVVALSHPGFEDVLAAAGADRVIEIPGRWFGLLHLSPRRIARLRREAFDEVVVPQMTPFGDLHSNIYRVVAAMRPSRMVVIPGERPPDVIEADAILRFTVRYTIAAVCARIDTPLLLALLVAVHLAPRRRSQRRTGRTRVLHIIPSLGVGGAQRQLAEVVNRTPADRYDVDVLVFGRDGDEFARQWFSRDVTITYLTRWPRFFLSVFDVRRHCIQGDYDVVHAWLFMANVVGVAGARLAGVRQIIASVRSMSLWKRHWYRQWWYRAADVLGTHAADVVTVNAEALAADHGAWARYPAHRIQVVPNGLEPSQFLVDAADARRHVRVAAGVPAGGLVVGTVGRLAHEKDHGAFLRMIASVRQVDSRVHGVIVGDGQLRAPLEALAGELGLAGHVSFLGERDDARRLMAGFDVFVLPSTIEGFPNVLLEAAFLGVPSVASRVGGSPEILTDPRDLFEVGDSDRAARRVVALLGDRSGAASGAELTRQRAFTRFTVDQTAKRWFALYDRTRHSGGSHEA